MKITRNLWGQKSILLFAILFILDNNTLLAQVDSTRTTKTDSTKVIAVDTTKKAEAKEKEKKVQDRFIAYGGGNVNMMDVSSSKYKAESGVGYHLGVAYRRGGFFYWQVGARYSNAEYNFVSIPTNTDTTKLAVRAVDIPLTVGINFLTFVNRVVNLRAFVSAVPAFTLGVGDNNIGFTKDHVNSFVFYGQLGVGADIAFFVVEVGYNYGFQDMLKNHSNSNPSQGFVSLGFRF